MLRVLRAELMKAQWKVLLPLVLAGPTLSAALGGPGQLERGMDKWTAFFSMSAIRYGWLFYPLLAGVFAALLCRSEHLDGGWKQMLSLPVSRTSVYLAKYAMLAGLLLAANVAFVAVFLAEAKLLRFAGPVPWAMFARSLVGGWLAVLPLAALQLWVSTRWRSFGAGLALNVCLTLPAIFAAQSEKFGPWYPWAQPVLAMMPRAAAHGEMALNVSSTTLWVVIVGGFVVAMAGGLATFARADVRG
jgi:hypothetical protein